MVSIAIIARFMIGTLRFLFTFNKIVVVLLFFTLCAVKNLSDEVIRLREHTVFDVDQIRNAMMNNMTFMFSEGCQTGVRYPAEYQKSQTEFNQHSPVNWCAEQREQFQDYIDREVYAAGRQNRE